MCTRLLEPDQISHKQCMMANNYVHRPLFEKVVKNAARQNSAHE